MCVCVCTSHLCNCYSLLTTRWSYNLARDMESVYDRHLQLIGRHNRDSSGVSKKSLIEEDITGCSNPFTFATKRTSKVFASHLLLYGTYSTSITSLQCLA